MGSLVWGIIKAGENWGWTSTNTWVFLGGAAVLLALFAAWQTRAKEPLIPLRLFRSVPLSAGVVLMVLTAFVFIGGLFFFAFYLQGVKGLSPVDSGLYLLPLTAAIIVCSPLATALISKIGPRIPLGGAMLLTAATLFGMNTLTPDTGVLALSVWFGLLGVSLTPLFLGVIEVIVGNAPLELSGVAGGLQQTAMQVGAALGTAVLGAVMSSKASSSFAEHWKNAGLPAPADPGLQQAAKFGMVPPELAQAPGMTQHLATTIGKVIHDSFMDGMGLALTAAGVIAVVAALLAMLVKRGENTQADARAGH